MIKVNTVGGQTLPGSDINTDKFNNYCNEILHTYLLTFIKNIYTNHRLHIPVSAYTLDVIYHHHKNPL